MGEGGSRRLTDEAPDKIQFFAKRKSSQTYPIKYFVLYSECKRIQHEGFYIANGCAVCGRRGQSAILPYIREVLTLSKMPKRSFVILKRGGEG